MRQLHFRRVVILLFSLISLAITMAGSTLITHAQQPIPCQDNAQSCFGDLDTDYNGPGSKDDFTLYSPPQNFITWAENSGPATTPPGTGPKLLRNSDEPSGANRPFILTGYTPFNPNRVEQAILRVDFHFGSVPSDPASDTIRFWNEQATSGDYSTDSIGYGFGLRVASLLCSFPWTETSCQGISPRWISLDIDLKNGTARAFELDPTTGDRGGLIQPIGGGSARCDPSSNAFGCIWGSNALVTTDRGTPQKVLDLAADGKLYGLIEDDSALSYVSLTIKAEPLPPVCATVLDNFNRPDDRLRAPWRGAEGRPNYRIVNQQLDPERGGPIYWREIFEANQAACVTLAHVDPNGEHQSVLLKIQGDWRQGAIAVFYDARAEQVGIETFVPRRGWQDLVTVPGLRLRDGDQLAGRALANGKVQAYVNNFLIAETIAEPLHNNRRGQIGLWFIQAADALLDDFSGGTVVP